MTTGSPVAEDFAEKIAFVSTDKGPAASDTVMAETTVSTALAGDQDQDQIETGRSFEEFYRHDFPSVLGLAFVLTGNQHVAEDTTQEAFTAAFRKWSTIGGYDSPEAWVRRVACNQAASAVRRRVREAKALLRLAGRLNGEIELDEGDEAFWQAVRRLPPRQAQAIALRYMEDFSVSQIAEVLDCSEGTVKTHLSRGRDAVARALQLEN